MEKSYGGALSSPVADMARSGKMLFLSIILTISAVVAISEIFHSRDVSLAYKLLELPLPILLCIGAWNVYMNASHVGASMMRVIITIKYVFAIIATVAICVASIILFIAIVGNEIGSPFAFFLLFSVIIIYNILVCNYLGKLRIMLGDAATCLEKGCPVSRRVNPLAGISMLFFILACISAVVSIVFAAMSYNLSNFIGRFVYDLPRDLRNSFGYSVYDMSQSFWGGRGNGVLYTLLVAPLSPITYFLVFSFARKYR